MAFAGIIRRFIFTLAFRDVRSPIEKAPVPKSRTLFSSD